MARENTPNKTNHLKNKDWESGIDWLGTNVPSGWEKSKFMGLEHHLHLCATMICLIHTLPSTLHHAHLLPSLLLHSNTNFILAIKPWVNIPSGQMPKQASILSLLPEVKFHYV